MESQGESGRGSCVVQKERGVSPLRAKLLDLIC